MSGDFWVKKKCPPFDCFKRAVLLLLFSHCRCLLSFYWFIHFEILLYERFRSETRGFCSLVCILMHFLYNLTGESFLLERLVFILLSLRLESTRCRPPVVSFLQCWMSCASGGWVEQLNRRDTTKIVFCFMVYSSETIWLTVHSLNYCLHYIILWLVNTFSFTAHCNTNLGTINLNQPTFELPPPIFNHNVYTNLFPLRQFSDRGRVKQDCETKSIKSECTGSVSSSSLDKIFWMSLRKQYVSVDRCQKNPT